MIHMHSSLAYFLQELLHGRFVVLQQLLFRTVVLEANVAAGHFFGHGHLALDAVDGLLARVAVALTQAFDLVLFVDVDDDDGVADESQHFCLEQDGGVDQDEFAA